MLLKALVGRLFESQVLGQANGVCHWVIENKNVLRIVGTADMQSVTTGTVVCRTDNPGHWFSLVNGIQWHKILKIQLFLFPFVWEALYQIIKNQKTTEGSFSVISQNKDLFELHIGYFYYNRSEY